mgnify:FL=1
MQQLNNFAEKYLANLHIPYIQVTDILEIIIISFLVYHILLWIKQTRAWALLKGLIVILVFLFIAVLLNMTTILWIAQNVFSIAMIALVVMLQPELRKALEELGRKNFFSSMLVDKKDINKLSSRTINEIVKACVEMAKVRTGALIVVEKMQSLADYERTGIEVDGLVSSQLLINIFEKNTPLHDGAVIIHENRVTSATCYLPLSDNMALSKELGTRHRAGIGISEVTDSVTVIVSEETGKISVAHEGELETNLDADRLRECLTNLTLEPDKEEEKKRFPWKGRAKK